MQLDAFAALPDESLLWIYGFPTDLSSAAKQLIGRRLSLFLEEWETHSQPVQGAFQFVEDRFVLLAGYAPGGISGCSIDSSVRVFKALSGEGLEALDRSRIYYRARNDSVESIHFSRFQKEIDEGRVGAQSRVFDTRLANLGQLRSEGFEKPLAESWHARAFSLPELEDRRLAIGD